MDGLDEYDEGNFITLKQLRQTEPPYNDEDRIKVVKFLRAKLRNQRRLRLAWAIWLAFGLITITLLYISTYIMWACAFWFLVTLVIISLIAKGKINLRLFFTLKEPSSQVLEQITTDLGTKELIKLAYDFLQNKRRIALPSGIDEHIFVIEKIQ